MPAKSKGGTASVAGGEEMATLVDMGQVPAALESIAEEKTTRPQARRVLELIAQAVRMQQRIGRRRGDARPVRLEEPRGMVNVLRRSRA